MRGPATKHPLHQTWKMMKERCARPRHPHFARYGGRGIRVCERWLASFWNFVADMGPKPAGDHTLDRKDNDGNYEPGNCRWATPAAQGANKAAAQGQRQGSSILRDDDVREIDRLLRSGARIADIACNAGVSASAIDHIKRGRNWSWLTGRGARSAEAQS